LGWLEIAEFSGYGFFKVMSTITTEVMVIVMDTTVKIGVVDMMTAGNIGFEEVDTAEIR